MKTQTSTRRYKCKNGFVQKPPKSQNCKKKTRMRCKNGSRRNRASRRCRKTSMSASSKKNGTDVEDEEQSSSAVMTTMKRASPLLSTLTK